MEIEGSRKRPRENDDLCVNSSKKTIQRSNILSSTSVFVFDTETTSLSPDNGYIVQFCGTLGVVDDNRVIETKHINRIVRPLGWAIPSSATKIHGITHQYALRKGILITEVLDAIFEVLEEHKPILVGHNIGFDIKFLISEIKRHGNLQEQERRIELLNSLPKICTMEISKPIFKIYRKDGKCIKNPSLTECYERITNMQMVNAHNAVVDVKTTIVVLSFLLKNRHVVLAQ